MAYVPPALRRKHEVAASGDDANNSGPPAPAAHDIVPVDKSLPSVTDIQHHFWPKDTADINSIVPEEDDDNDDQQQQQRKFTFTKSHSTLNGSSDSPDKLVYILLFKDANPRWDRDGILFAKTNLYLLPAKHNDSNEQEPKLPATSTGDEAMQQASIETEAGEPLSSTARDEHVIPIMIFQQFKSRDSGFDFLGYYHITDLDFLEPNTPELVRMLEQKFTLTNRWGKSRQYQRDHTAWKGSLGQRWAVLKLKRDEEANQVLDAPVIEVREVDHQTQTSERKEKKSVNELLQEMRLGQI